MLRVKTLLAALLMGTLAHAQFTMLESVMDRMLASTQHVFHALGESASHWTTPHYQEAASDAWHKMEQDAVAWMEAGMETVGGMTYQKLLHPAFPDYQLRLAVESSEQKAQFCDPDVKQIKGYLDIRDDAHLWFILYESRSNPETDPLVMWLNGGPGCSSSTGMLMELGPCWVSDEGEKTSYNEYAWNSKANLLFLDQPLQVGYSYSDSGEMVDNSDKSAEDVYAFLQLFFTRFPKYAALPFSVAAESYGGHYAPHIGAEIQKRNKELAQTPPGANVTAAVPIRLESLMIGNGLTDPKIQFPSVVDFACSPDNKYHLFEPDSEVCQSLESKSQICSTLIDACEQLDSRISCVPAALYCWGSLYGPAQDSGRNLYDVRRSCDREKDGQLCFREMGYIEALMNKPKVKSMLGVPEQVQFQSCNMDVNGRFMMQGDSIKNSATLLEPLLEDGIRVLLYAGETDFMCNAIGIHQWVLDFPNVYHEAINNATEVPFFTRSENGAKPRKGGYVIKAGQGAGNLAFAWISRAGHMVPHDQPALALHMLNRWLANKDLTM